MLVDLEPQDIDPSQYETLYCGFYYASRLIRGQKLPLPVLKRIITTK